MAIDKNKVLKNRLELEKKVNVNIRVLKSASEFMKKRNYSPTAIFQEALKELGWDPDEEAAEEPVNAPEEQPAGGR